MRAPLARASSTCLRTMSSWKSTVMPPMSALPVSPALTTSLWINVGVAGVAGVDHQFVDFGLQRLHEPVVNTVLHVDAFHRTAGLTGIGERAPQHAFCCAPDIHIVENDGLIFSTQFQVHRNQFLGGLRQNFLAGAGAAGEKDFSRALVDQALGGDAGAVGNEHTLLQ